MKSRNLKTNFLKSSWLIGYDIILSESDKMILLAEFSRILQPRNISERDIKGKWYLLLYITLGQKFLERLGPKSASFECQQSSKLFYWGHQKSTGNFFLCNEIYFAFEKCLDELILLYLFNAQSFFKAMSWIKTLFYPVLSKSGNRTWSKML